MVRIALPPEKISWAGYGLLAGVLGAVLVAVFVDWQIGGYILAGVALMVGLLRLVLPGEIAGILVSRSKYWDFALGVLAALALATIVYLTPDFYVSGG